MGAKPRLEPYKGQMAYSIYSVHNARNPISHESPYIGSSWLEDIQAGQNQTVKVYPGDTLTPFIEYLGEAQLPAGHETIKAFHYRVGYREHPSTVRELYSSEQYNVATIAVEVYGGDQQFNVEGITFTDIHIEYLDKYETSSAPNTGDTGGRWTPFRCDPSLVDIDDSTNTVKLRFE
ncbi:hypothetical protein [Vibrio bivalvicida]|uniref:Uncharacterized protein n=3 Tax=Vibrionaceae TaxID=641 RepID=A0A0H3ZQJ2_VIBSP|nr:hypothetical protein [Vibrio splendidus]AKN40534.1 hypothetical protein [Enterovibrio norvegicus]